MPEPDRRVDDRELDGLVDQVADDLKSELVDRLRDALAKKDRAWLAEHLARRLAAEHRLDKAPRSLAREGDHTEPPAARRQRLVRIRNLDLDVARLQEELARFQGLDRDGLIQKGYLLDPPHKGKRALTAQDRSAAGEDLLQEAHDLFYALLFCDENQNVTLPRSRRDFLTVTLPAAKKEQLERFMLAVTEIPALGTWLDPDGVSDDVGARNTVLQVEFGDGPDHVVSDALMTVLGLINHLEINEEILYARIECLERSSLVG